ncbi:MAG: endonuclease III domain-containing protein [Thermoplasmata archaeon]
MGKIETIMKNLRRRYEVGAFPGKTAGNSLQKEMRHPYRVLISTILSHRTKDENTHRASSNLFAKYPTVQDVAGAPLKEIERLIRPSGFYRVKARRIREVSRTLLKEYGGKVPRDFDKLVSLPSVGRKTANCVLVYAFGEPAVPVDVHVHKIANRIGLVDTQTPEQTEEELIRIVPRKYWLELNELFVRFGQDICRSVRPKCEVCDFNSFCGYCQNRRGK